MFVSEVLHHSIHEEEKNESLWLSRSGLALLDNHLMANLILMLETTKYLGFYPDTSDMDMPFFWNDWEVFYSFTLLWVSMKLICLKTNTLRFDTDQKIFHVIERQLL
jgi:DNA repair protein RecO (recombination protein O)